jgi:photosystem II stability/assembly factor-like uncharacterized protein
VEGRTIQRVVPRRRPGRTPLALLIVATLLALGCGPATSPSPGTPAPAATPGQAGTSASTSRPSPRPAVAGLDWRAAEDVARPEDAFPSGTAAPTAPDGPGTAGHPGHFPGQATIADVVVARDRLVAVGYVGWEWRPVAWTSTDGDHWALVEIGRPVPGDPAFAQAVADSPSGGLVAVGSSGHTAAAWTSVDGSAWTDHPIAVLGGPDEWERMTAVAAGPAGLVAGGSVGPELFERRARFWRSGDGVAWTPAPDDDAFADAEVTAILPLDDGWLAAGRLGTGQRTTGSVAWRSADGQHWTRVDDPALALGHVRALAHMADGSIVAVGSEPNEIGAYAWRSVDDGRTWTLAPEDDALTHFGQKIRMTDVIPTPNGLLAIGNLVGVQYGSGLSWTSADGVHWHRSPIQPSMGQAEPEAVVSFGPGYVMVGTFGAPDNYIPRAWVSPPG